MYGAEAPGASSGMVSNVPGTVIRSPTDSSAPRVAWKASSLLEVIGNSPMNACTLTADQTSSELLVTSPLTVTLPLFGIEDGVRVSMVSDSGASSAAAAGAGCRRPPLRPPLAPPWRPGCRTRATRPPPGQAAASSVGAPCDGSPGEAPHRAGH